MKAFYCQSYGGADVMRHGELPAPTAGRGQVLVRVRAASINPLDWKIRQGDFRLLTGRRFPKVLGADVAGVVEALGPGASGLVVGQRVYGVVPIFLGRQGAHAELVTLAAKRLRPLPEGWSFEQAAALPVAALTALNGLRRCGALKDRAVLVNGATGGVGHLAVQLAKARGARVTGVCSARNAERARALGCEQVVDYRQQSLAELGRAFDVIFDAYGLLGFTRAATALTASGHYATTLPTPGVMLHALWRRVLGGQQIVGANMRARGEDYDELQQLVTSGALRPIVEQVFPLAEAAQAFALAERGGAVGKIVLRLGG